MTPGASERRGPTRVAVRRGLPELAAGSQSADLVRRLQGLAAVLGLRLDRFELVPEGATDNMADGAYWTIGDLPSPVEFDSLEEARWTLAEQIHVRVGDGDVGSAEALAELGFLRWMAQCAVERLECGGQEPPDVDEEQEF